MISEKAKLLKNGIWFATPITFWFFSISIFPFSVVCLGCCWAEASISMKLSCNCLND